MWSIRHITIESKTLVLHNEILLVLQYSSEAWPSHVTVCQAITKTFCFIWGPKMDRLKWTIMYKEKGGKGIPDIPTLLQASIVCNTVCWTRK